MKLIVLRIYFAIDEGRCTAEGCIQEEEWESIVFKFNDSKRYRRIVGSIAGSCLVAVTPLISSADAAACLIALDIIEVTFISHTLLFCG